VSRTADRKVARGNRRGRKGKAKEFSARSPVTRSRARGTSSTREAQSQRVAKHEAEADAALKQPYTRPSSAPTRIDQPIAQDGGVWRSVVIGIYLPRWTRDTLGPLA
jgi:hypothetical protein